MSRSKKLIPYLLRAFFPSKASQGQKAFPAVMDGALQLRRILYDAACNGQEEEVVRLVREHESVDADMRDCALWGAVGEGHEGLVVRLLEAGADPQGGNCGANDLLCLAASVGNGGVVARLLHAGANPCAFRSECLSDAATHGREDIVVQLLTAGARPEDDEGRSLAVAARRGHEGVVARLLEHGANPLPALMTAVDGGHARIAHMLVDECINRAGGPTLNGGMSE